MVSNIRDRESEMVTYLRNTIADPSTRGTSKTDTFSATAAQTVFTLTQTLVKNVVSVTVDGVAKYNGYAYNTSYGEGTAVSTVTLLTACTVSQAVVITYKYGVVMIYEGMQRDDVALPRIAIISPNLTPDFMSIGEDGGSGGGHWVFLDGQYVAEVRSRYAKQCKDLLNTTFNALNQFRQQTPQPYMVIISRVQSIQPLDFDNELRVYRGRIVFTIRWMHKFND
jgi:hypothetical protein